MSLANISPKVGVVTVICDLVNFGALNDTSSKTAEGTNVKFGRRVRRDNPDKTPDKSF